MGEKLSASVTGTGPPPGKAGAAMWRMKQQARQKRQAAQQHQELLDAIEQAGQPQQDLQPKRWIPPGTKQRVRPASSSRQVSGTAGNWAGDLYSRRSAIPENRGAGYGQAEVRHAQAPVGHAPAAGPPPAPCAASREPAIFARFADAVVRADTAQLRRLRRIGGPVRGAAGRAADERAGADPGMAARPEVGRRSGGSHQVASRAGTCAGRERQEPAADQGLTMKGRIMSLSSCSTMWQWWT